MTSDYDEEDRKLFVGGLPQEATQKDLEVGPERRRKTQKIKNAFVGVF